MQPQQYEKSKISVTFGEPFEQSPFNVSWNLSLTEKKSLEQITKLKALVGDAIDLDYALVIEIPNAINPDTLLDAIQHIYSKEFKNYLEKYPFKTHKSDEGKIYCSIKLNSESEVNALGIVKVLLEGGFQQIVTQQENLLQGNLQFNQDLKDVSKRLQEGERLGSVLLKNLNFNVSVDLHNQFANCLEDVVKSIDEEFLESPIMLFIKYFKNLDVDYQFKNSDQLPQIFRNQVLFGEKFASIPKENWSFKLEENPYMKSMVENIGVECNFYLTIQGFGALSIQAKTPGLGKFLFKYGKALETLILKPDEEETQQK